MDKRYQVFVSSTYADLQEERQEVMQALLELDCIPAGMELFPAANEDQWTLIKKVIDDCDYYIVILAGRYGSIGPDGRSYTEMEYRYALDASKPVIGFIHRDPGALPANRCEATDDGKGRLTAFREIVQNKACRFWETPADLGSQVSRSLIKLIKSHPGVGWVRGSLVPDESAIEEILGLRRLVEELQAELEASRLCAPEGTSGLAQGSDVFELHFSFVTYGHEFDIDGTSYSHSVAVSWDNIFSSVSPLMINETSERQFSDALTALAREAALPEIRNIPGLKNRQLGSFDVNNDDFHTVKVQLRALGLITKSAKNRSVKDTETYWTLTPYGDNVMTRLRAIRNLQKS
jgi:hypothetical protein